MPISSLYSERVRRYPWMMLRALFASVPLSLFSVFCSLLVTFAVTPSASAQGDEGETIIPLDDIAPSDDATHFFVPFEVPAGIAEIEVRHRGLVSGNVLDWGLEDPDGFRGWGGGLTEPSIVNAEAASRGYVPGPITPGTWRVVIGKALIVEEPAEYELEVVLRETPTLAPQTERTPYTEREPLEVGRRWYAGDFHVHSRESGDATPTLDEIAELALSRGLDFVVITDHNTHTNLDFFADVAERYPELLFVPGVEFTTYAGHGNAIFATEWVDHKLGVEGATIEGALNAYREQDAFFSINHPVHELGNMCIGCAWEIDVDPALIDGVEIGSLEIDTVGHLFVDKALAFWDELLDGGSRAVALGGSDDHRAGQNLSGTQSPIGSPTTMVEADELSVRGIREALRAGRTSVKMGNPDDPLAYIEPFEGKFTGDPIELTLKVVGASEGQTLALLENGRALRTWELEDGDRTIEVQLAPPAEGARYRVEVHESYPRAVSSHVFVDPSEGGCGCSASNTHEALLPLALIAFFILIRRRAQDRPA